jgi:hypothetical protein
MGDPADPSTDLGPVVSEAHLEKVRAAVEKAVAEGAQVPFPPHHIPHFLSWSGHHRGSLFPCPLERILFPPNHLDRFPLCPVL